MKTFLRWQMNIFLNFFLENITLQQDVLESQEKKTEGGKVLDERKINDLCMDLWRL